MSDIDLETESIVEGEKYCPGCNNVILSESRFCKHCGQLLSDNEADSTDKFANIKQVAILFVLEAIVCAVGNFIDYFDTLSWHIIFNIILAGASVTFFAINWTRNKEILHWRGFSVVKLISYCSCAIGGSLVVSLIVDWLNKSIFSKEFSYYQFYSQYQYGKLLAIFFVSVMPALFEELAYRGFVIGKLLNVVDKKQAIFISSFLFAIMHMSFISLFWLIPFALCLGYLRIKENTLWYGVCVHFTFNFTVLIMEFFRY